MDASKFQKMRTVEVRTPKLLHPTCRDRRSKCEDKNGSEIVVGDGANSVAGSVGRFGHRPRGARKLKP
jgi:hypothetical protein